MIKQLAAILFLTATFLAVPASAQAASGGSAEQGMIEIAALSIAPNDTSSLGNTRNAIPIPTPRPETIRNTAPQEPIERTAEGYRLIGPRFFPAQ
ncbi:hypothetical protein VQ042_01455 [Aurantimonas sp. A2-1-M11]|uniref:hypothetical protein n=1 Tax=Aurantimonas sp. A2-1-M11 TaxID=3113712 RepID=UPI002F9409DA